MPKPYDPVLHHLLGIYGRAIHRRAIALTRNVYVPATKRKHDRRVATARANIEQYVARTLAGKPTLKLERGGQRA